MDNNEFENIEIEEINDDIDSEEFDDVLPEEGAFAEGALFIDEDEREREASFKLPIVAIIAITIAVLFAVSCYFIIGFSKEKQRLESELAGMTTPQGYMAEVYDGQLYINGVAVDSDEVGISDDEVEEYASRVNSGSVTVNQNVVNNNNITTRAPAVNTGGNATPNAGNNNSATTTTTQPSVIKVKNIYFTGSSAQLYVGESKKLGWTFAPYNTSQKGITFASSDTAVATVDHIGNVKAVGLGTATITVTSKFDSKISDTYKIYVVEEKTTAKPITLPSRPTTTQPTTTEPPTTHRPTTRPTTTKPTTAYVPVNVSDIKINNLGLGKTKIISVGGTSMLIFTLSPSNATVNDLEFYSVNPDNRMQDASHICSVSSNGKICGNSAGKALIIVKAKNGTAVDEFTVTVNDK